MTERHILTRRQFFTACGWSDATGARRERSDPAFPIRVEIGARRFGYYSDEAETYINSRRRSPPKPDAEAMARTARAREARAAKRELAKA